MSRARRRQSKPDRLLHLGEAIDRMPDVVRMYDDDPSSDPDPARLRDGMKRIGLYLESATGSKLSQGEVMASMDAAGVGVGAWWQEALGYQPARKPFHSTARRECPKCHGVFDADRFDDLTIYPGQPDKGWCKQCAVNAS